MATLNRVEIGSVSSGTLRTEDLLEAFADELERISDGAYASLINDAREAGAEPEDAEYIVDELQDALNEYAPPHTYFGSLPGDGADFGFWPEDILEWSCERVRISDEVFIDPECGLYVHVSDHGNVEVFTIAPGDSVWSAV